MTAQQEGDPKPKALVLVGGYGTRLRPLTLTVPKPIVDFANKPMICHQIEALKEAGCDEVVLAINYRPHVMMEFLKEWEEKLDIKITCSQEEEPMGTAGPLAWPGKYWTTDDGFHKKSKAEATILVTKVEDPSKYGVVVYDKESGLIDRFVEKPKEFVGDRINAGIYCCSPEILQRIEPRPTSIEKEIFPAVAADKKLYATELDGYWMDVGQPQDYLTGLALHLASKKRKRSEELAQGDNIEGNVIIDSPARLARAARLVQTSLLVRVRDWRWCSFIKLCPAASCQGEELFSCGDSILGWGTQVGRWARIENKAVIGEDVFIKDEVALNGAIVLPHKDIKESVTEPGKIIM
eukprot:jgi/Picre1/32640/NNA_007986.t1